MRRSLQAGNRVQLSELGRRGAKKQTRKGTVLKVSRSGTQCRMTWDDVRSPQLIHVDLLELIPPERGLSGDHLSDNVRRPELHCRPLE